ncbi:MAG: hypothetical protein ACOCSG_02150, partial [Guyparkeria sp.]
TVSFALALNVALRARGTRISRPLNLLRAYWHLVRQRPASLVYPPAADVDTSTEAAHDGNAATTTSRDEPGNHGDR